MNKPTTSKHRANEWYKEVEERHKEVEEQRQQTIDNAIKAGIIIPAERLFEPYQRYELVARRLSNTPDRIKAFAILDEMVEREAGAYHISIDGAKVFQNTTDTALLARMVYTKIAKELEKMSERGPMALLFLEQWKDRPMPVNKWSLPDELKTARAVKAVARAIDAGLIESTPEGLKWRGIGAGKNISQLAYFCRLAWCPNDTERLPETAVNNLFHVTRIGSYITALLNCRKVQKWRLQIDKLFVE